MQIAFRAALLEQENAILRTQVVALHDEVGTLRKVLCVQQSTAARPPAIGGGVVDNTASMSMR